MRVIHRHKVSQGIAPSTVQVDLKHLYGRRHALQQRLEVLDETLAEYDRAVATHSLRQRLADIQGEVQKVEAEGLEERKRIDEDKTFVSRFDMSIKAATDERDALRVQIEELRVRYEELEERINTLQQERQSYVLLQEKRLVDSLGQEGKRIRQLQKTFVTTKKKYHQETHRPAKLAREGRRQRDKLQRRLDEVNRDIARFEAKSGVLESDVVLAPAARMAELER